MEEGYATVIPNGSFKMEGRAMHAWKRSEMAIRMPTAEVQRKLPDGSVSQAQFERSANRAFQDPARGKPLSGFMRFNRL